VAMVFKFRSRGWLVSRYSFARNHVLWNYHGLHSGSILFRYNTKFSFILTLKANFWSVKYWFHINSEFRCKL
jgi:hypothetical protein